MQFICYSRCTTCHKAQRWLDEQAIDYQARDIKEQNPSYQELKAWHLLSGLPLRRFFNTSGQLYRSMGLKDKLGSMGEEEQLQLLASDGLLVKRPLLVQQDKVLVGFRQAEWEAALT